MSFHKTPFYRRICRKMVYLTAPFWGDEAFLRTYFWCNLGYILNLNNPKTYNEKLQWLKLHDQRPEYTRMVDKIEAKEYVRTIIGDEYIIPTLTIYDNVEDVDFDKLPNQFVIKCTHDSGGVVVCRDKNNIDKTKILKKLKKGLKQDFTYLTREYPYKSVKPRLIAEEYMEDEDGELKDYKIFCFNGEPKISFVASDRQKEDEETKFDFYDIEWNHLPFTNGHPNGLPIPKPKNYGLMLDLARKLSKGIPHVRVDLYNVNGRIYFGELTFFHWSGFIPFEPEEWDYKLGEWLQLPKIQNK